MPESTPQSSGNNPPFGNILLDVNFSNPAEVAKKETGLKLSQKIYADQTTQQGNINFFTARAARWINIDKWAKGTQDMTEFLDFFNVSNGNKAYVKIDMTPTMVGAQFVGTLVESMSKNEEYPCVTAIDDDSLDEKEQRKMDALFRMHEIETLNALQQEAGMLFEPPNAYVPDDELSAEVYFELEDRLPKEIRFEEKLNATLIFNKYERVLKRRLIYDLVVKNAAFTKIERDGKQKRIRKCIPENMFYNYIIGDTGDMELSYIGEVYSMKIKDMRMKYGKSKENPDGLTEKDIFEFAKYANRASMPMAFQWQWLPQYELYNNNRPWDDYNIYVFDYEIKVLINDYYVSKTDSFGKENIVPKKGVPEPTSPNARTLARTKERWYRGIYAPYCGKMVYWGPTDLILIPYGDTRTSLCSYSINIPHNNGEYVPSLFERAMEPLKRYAIGNLKMKQLIAKLRPSGINIDVESARNLDLGGGNIIEWEEVVRIYDQTGNQLWSSRGVDPNQREAPPLSATPHDDTINKIIELNNINLSAYNDIRLLLGVPTYRDGADVGERTSGKLSEQQNISSFNVTDYILNGHNQLMEETLYKCCLLDWQDVVTDKKESEQDLINTKFQVYVRMKLTAYEREMLERDINTWSQVLDASGKPLISPNDAFMIRNIKNYKLAAKVLANTIESNRRKSMEESMKLQEQNAMVQSQAAQQKAQADAQMLQDKIAADKEMKEFESNNKKQEILLTSILKMYELQLTPKPMGEGGGMTVQAPMPPELQQLAQVVLKNVAMPLVQENQQQEQGMVMQAMQEQMMAQQAQQQMPM